MRAGESAGAGDDMGKARGGVEHQGQSSEGSGAEQEGKASGVK